MTIGGMVIQLSAISEHHAQNRTKSSVLMARTDHSDRVPTYVQIDPGSATTYPTLNTRHAATSTVRSVSILCERSERVPLGCSLRSHTMATHELKLREGTRADALVASHRGAYVVSVVRASPGETAKLFRALPSLPNLTSLDLCELSLKKIPGFPETVAGVPFLLSLKLTFVTDFDVRALLGAVQAHPHITSLVLNEIELGDEHAPRLAALIMKLNVIVIVPTVSRRFTEASAAPLADALTKTQTLREFWLGADFPPAAVRTVARGIERNVSLRIAEYVTEATYPRAVFARALALAVERRARCVALSRARASPARSLTPRSGTLGTSHPRTVFFVSTDDDDEAEVVAEMLENDGLVNLVMRGSSRIVLAAATATHRLVTVDIQGMDLVAADLVNVLSENPSLRSLSTDASFDVIDIIVAVEGHRNLKSLVLSGTPMVNDDDVDSVVSLVLNLETLRLRLDHMTDASVAGLADAVEHTPTLAVWDLGEVQFSYRMMGILEESVDRNTTLTDITFTWPINQSVIHIRHMDQFLLRMQTTVREAAEARYQSVRAQQEVLAFSSALITGSPRKGKTPAAAFLGQSGDHALMHRVRAFLE